MQCARLKCMSLGRGCWKTDIRKDCLDPIERLELRFHHFLEDILKDLE